MPTLTITKSYSDGNILTEAMLDDIKNSVETFINVTKLASDNIQANGIVSTNINNLAVTTAKIDNLAVTDAKLAADSVITSKILDANITDVKLASNSVITSKILDANVTAPKLATDSVITAKIMDANVTGAKIESNVHLAGTGVLVGGKNVVTEFNSSVNKMIVAGFTTSGGSVTLDSAGISSTSSSGTGQLTLNFISPFSTNPVILCTAKAANVQCEVTAANGNGFSVQWTNNAGSAVNVDFYFFAMGAR